MIESVFSVGHSIVVPSVLVHVALCCGNLLYECRYYVAEGVRLYSQESWRIITENRGVELVGKYIKNVVSFEQLPMCPHYLFLSSSLSPPSLFCSSLNL